MTDGNVGVGPSSLGACLSGGSSSPLPFSFPGSLSVMCLASKEEAGVAQAMPMYQRLIELAGGHGTLYMPEGPLTPKVFIMSNYVLSVFNYITRFKYYIITLKFES